MALPDLTSHTIYWLGGAPCAGKSTVAQRLAEANDLVLYECDAAAGDNTVASLHPSRSDAVHHPTIYRVARTPWDVLFMRPVAEMLCDVLRYYAEEWPMIIEDLAALPAGQPILVEGNALLPNLVSSPEPCQSRAVWLAPSEQFLRQHYPKRSEWVGQALARFSNPEAAFSNWMDRDVAFAAHILAEASRLGCRWMVVDGSQNDAQVTQRVANLLHLSCSPQGSTTEDVEIP
jgi:hypothetical protein